MLTDNNFDKVVYNSPDIWIIVFSVEFCKHCKAFAPIYKEASEALAGKVNFGYIDAIENSGLQKRFGITSVPQVYYWEPGYFKTDADVQKYAGEKSVEALSQTFSPIHDTYMSDMYAAHTKKPLSRWGQNNRVGTPYAAPGTSPQ